MGAEVQCRARVGGVTDTGKALLETEELLFRGTKLRQAVRFADTRKATVTGGWLKLGPLELGRARATKWATAIAHPKSVLDKLGVKTGPNSRPAE